MRITHYHPGMPATVTNYHPGQTAHFIERKQLKILSEVRSASLYDDETLQVFVCTQNRDLVSPTM